ncbi:hypothetical protein FRC07_002434 [Ceratobasidium sp. 392]|nr:hypothetical protein FRC07_002434 [Ceratobasidium sp. 392]
MDDAAADLPQLEEDLPMGDTEAPHEDKPPERPSTLPNSHQAPPKRHGYVTVEPHPNAARVIRWIDPATSEVSNSHLDKPDLFQTAEWLCQLPISGLDWARYFEIEKHKAAVPWENVKGLYQEVDALPHGPDWSHKNLYISTWEGSETLNLYKRCIILGTRLLIGWRWWWGMQDALGPNATIAPNIFTMDATTVTLFTSQKVWPVYQLIANIDKDVRHLPKERAMILVGYIPMPDLSWITNDEERRHKRWEVYHASMAKILALLKQASLLGVEMVCADGGVRCVYPIVAAHMADFEEQCLASCTLKTRCPICDVTTKGRGSGENNANIRTKLGTLQALQYDRRGISMARQNLGLRPMWLYWTNLPYATGHSSFVPDLLHQVHNGMFKDHLLACWRYLLGTAMIDRQLIGMPRFAGLRHFRVGILAFFNGKWTGNESKEVERICLPLVAGSQPAKAVGATRCLMDFLYQAHLLQIDKDNLERMEADLAEFHNSKHIFVTRGGMGVAGWDNIPKLHMLSHYVFLIHKYGTPDGYNTKLSERLHIDYVKIPYRASNRVDPIQQMITHLQRSEAWAMQRYRLEQAGLIKQHQRAWADKQELEDDEDDSGVMGDASEQEDDKEEMREAREQDQARLTSTRRRPNQTMPKHHPDPTLFIANKPTRPSIPTQEIALHHEAPDFIETVKRFVSELPGGTEHA